MINRIKRILTLTLIILAYFLLLQCTEEVLQPEQTFITPEMHGAIGDGIVDDTKALQRSINSLIPVYLKQGKTYRITTGLVLQNHSNIYSDGSAVIYLGTDTGEFSNMLVEKRNDPSSVAFYGYGVDSVQLSDFRIEKQFGQEHIVSAILIRDATNIKVVNIDISGFSKARGILKFDSVISGLITENRIHDCKTADDYQLTAILIDDDRRSDKTGKIINSTDITVSKNHIWSLNVSEQMAEIDRFETDAIHVAGTGSYGIQIIQNEISHVGEGIDVFGQYIQVSDNNIFEPYGAGVKLVHGASNCTITQNTITRPGLWGIVIAGSPNLGIANTSSNKVTQNTIREPGNNSFAQWSNNTRSGIALVLPNNPQGYPVNNQVYDNYIEDITGVHYGILCEYGPNQIENNTLIGTPIKRKIRPCP